MVNYVKIIVALAIVLSLLSGCYRIGDEPVRKFAKLANAHLIQDINDTIHLFYNIQLGEYKEFHHLKMENNKWVELNDINLNEEIITVFNKNNDICLLTFNRFEEKQYRIVCTENNETIIYLCNTGIDFGGYNYVFLPEGYFVYHNGGYFYKYDPFLDKETKLFEAFGYIAGDFFPYIDTNGSWDGKSFIYYNSEAVELAYVDDDLQGRSLDVTTYGIEDEIYNNHHLSPHKGLHPYVIVKDKFYNMPVEGKIVAVANESLLIDNAGTYFGDPNLALLGVHDTVEEDGIFHHLDNFYSNSSEESRLTYEQYIPSQSEAVKSNVIFYHKVKNDF